MIRGNPGRMQRGTYTIDQIPLATYTITLKIPRRGLRGEEVEIDGKRYIMKEEGDKRLAPIARTYLLDLAARIIEEEGCSSMVISVPLLHGTVSSIGISGRS